MEANIPFNSGAIRAGDCISDGWNLIKDNYWLFLGIVLLGGVISGCIPCAGLFFIGPITVGIYICFFTQMRGQPVEFGMMFKGFEKFVPAMVLGLIEAIPGIIAQVVRFGVEFSNYGSKRGRGFDFFAQSDMGPALAGGLVIIAIIAGVGFFLFVIAWQITFKFALPILTEHGELGIGEIIKLSARAGWSNIGGIIVLVILQTLVALIGVLALCIGVLFVIPVIWASNAIAYRMVFPESPQGGIYNEPPRPDYYGGSFGQGA